MQKYLILTILAIAGTIIAPAATKQEMEQARALVAKWGVRSQNSGSGYLDGTNPKNLDQVRASVRSHKTDNANLGKLSLSMPSEEEYQSWDNAKMTSYWMSQYNSAVPAGGDKDFCRSKLKSQLASVPATVKAAPKAEKEPVETDPETVGTDEETAEETEEPTDSVENTADEGLATDIVDAAAANPEVEPLAAPGTNGEREAAKGTQELSGNSSNVWVIVMLVVLVLIVLALVGYASNITARNNKRNQGNPRRNRDRQRSEKENDNADDADDDDDDDSITAPRADQYNPASRPIEAESAAMAAAARRNATHRAAPRISQPRIIYLSNANSEGVFLRADAQYNMGNSIFKLITSDGYSGTFSVIDDPNVYEMALMMPVDFLINACSGRNLQLTDGARSIVTDSTGTAIFEDGRWRVARKARIHYTR